jgi:hypothetical protein
MFSEQPAVAAECYSADFSKKWAKMTLVLQRPLIEISKKPYNSGLLRKTDVARV